VFVFIRRLPILCVTFGRMETTLSQMIQDHRALSVGRTDKQSAIRQPSLAPPLLSVARRLFEHCDAAPAYLLGDCVGE
jgi:hypothetical protein